MTGAARMLGDDASHLYSVRDRGFKPVVAFKEAQDKGHSGYAGQLQQAFVKGVIEPMGDWHRELESLEVLVTQFDEIRIQHDHYRIKVEDLAQKVCVCVWCFIGVRVRVFSLTPACLPGAYLYVFHVFASA